MVELVISNFNQESELRMMLDAFNIEYQLCLNLGNHGILSPYLVVDCVPLDEERAIKYIRSKANG